MQGLHPVRLRLKELLMLDTDRASQASVAAHLKRYTDEVARFGGKVVAQDPPPTPQTPPSDWWIDGGAMLAALPNDLQYAILCHLSDYDTVALLACRKTPCFSEATCTELRALLFQGPLPPEDDPGLGHDISGLDNNEPPPRWSPAFPLEKGPYGAYDEFRRCSYLRGSTCKYAISVSPDGLYDNNRKSYRYESADVPGDTVRLSQVTTRLVGFAPNNLRLARMFAKDHWPCGKRPRWFPHLQRVTEQGNPTDGRVGRFVCKCS